MTFYVSAMQFLVAVARKDGRGLVCLLRHRECFEGDFSCKPTPELWLAMRFVSLRPGNAGQAKVIAKSSTAADMQSDRVVMTASQLHFFSQRILRPASTRECDVSHIHAVKIAMAAVVNSYSRLCQAYARARESFCTRRLRSCWASQCALMSGCISLK